MRTELQGGSDGCSFAGRSCAGSKLVNEFITLAPIIIHAHHHTFICAAGDGKHIDRSY